MNKAKRPIQFFIDAWVIFHEHLKLKTFQYKCDAAVSAFEQARKISPQVKLSGCMTNRKSAHSYMIDDVRRKLSNHIQTQRVCKGSIALTNNCGTCIKCILKL